MTRTSFRRVLALAVTIAAGVTVFSTAVQARIPCDEDNPSAQCRIATPPPARTTNVHKKKKVTSAQAAATIAHAIKTGQFGGPYNPQLANG